MAPVPLPIDPVIGRYESLAALLDDLETWPPALLPRGGSVCVHPTLLTEETVADYIWVRERLRAFGLRLIVTPAVGPEPVELRRSSRPPSDGEHGER